MLTSKFGIEIEFTGITREQAAVVAAQVLGGRASGRQVTVPDGRVWKFVSDCSISAQQKMHGSIYSASSDYQVEMVSPILTYREDIDTLQNLVRAMRKAGGFVNSKCGIHIHLNGADHTPRSIRNFVNIIASKNDLFYKALQIEPERMYYCQAMDAMLVAKMNRKNPKSFEQIQRIWYEDCGGDYHDTRYHFLNLHSFFMGHHTVELRGFNSTLHAGLVRSYIVLALALNNQALTQKSASARKPQTENEKFSMRTYLVRIGFKGEEFKNCREHLCKYLSGNAAWRFGSVA